jgi:hypothetical protein
MPLVPSKNPWQRRAIAIETDLPCVHCNYNLRGLHLSGVCPECAQPIWDALLNRDIAVLKRALFLAQIASFLLALWPWLTIELLVLGTSTSTLNFPGIVSLVINAAVLITQTCLWANLPVPHFQASPEQRFRSLVSGFVCTVITIVCALAVNPLIKAGLSPHVARQLVFVPGAIHYAIILMFPYQMLLLVRQYRLARAMQLAQILCVCLAILIIIAVVNELLLPYHRIAPAVLWLGIVTLADVTITSLICIATFRSVANPSISQRDL